MKDFRDAVMTDFRLAMQRDSELSGLFNHHLFKMKQAGAVGQIANRWIFKEKPLSDLSHRIFVQVMMIIINHQLLELIRLSSTVTAMVVAVL